MEARNLVIVFAVTVVVLGASLPLLGGEGPRISLVSSSAVRRAGTITVAVDLDLRSGRGPTEVRAILSALNGPPTIDRIAFFLDPQYPILGSLERVNGLLDHLRPALRERHYDRTVDLVDADGLLRILASSDRTVLIVATTVIPDTVLSRTANALTPWLKRGGVLVWTGDLIGAYIGHRGQLGVSWNDTQNLRWDGEKRIFGQPVIGNSSGALSESSVPTSTSTLLDLQFPIAEVGANLTLMQNRSWLPLGSILGSPFAASSISWIPVGSGGVILFGSGPELPFGYAAEDVVANDIAQTLMAAVPWWNLTVVPQRSNVFLAPGETRLTALLFDLPDTVPFARLYVFSRGPLRPAVLAHDSDFRTI